LRYLIQNGYTLVERNYRTRRGEIDLIVSKDDTLVLVLRDKPSPKTPVTAREPSGDTSTVSLSIL
jgi:hypothetical protein